MPALESITIKGFRSIASVEKLQLRPINVVIGPNGAGKSNFIGVFAFLHAIREGRLQDYVMRAGGAEKILHFGSKITGEIVIKVAFSEWVNQYEIILAPTLSDEIVPSGEWGYYWDRAKFTRPMSISIPNNGKEAGICVSRQKGIISFVAFHLERWRVYHFHDTSSSSPMKKTSDISDNRFLRQDASNLSAFLYLLRKQYPAEYGLIQRAVQRVAPFFDDFTLAPQALNPEKIRLEWKHRRSDAYFDAAALSDGTLRFIALATLLLQPEVLRPSVVLLDEPELGLHPYAITILAALVRQASVRTQVIISTQSPLLLDQFEPADVLVADQVEGATTFNRLDEARLSAWLQDYSLGQLWEKGELGGRPGGQ